MSGSRGVATRQEGRRLPGAFSKEAMVGRQKRKTKQVLGEKGKHDRGKWWRK